MKPLWETTRGKTTFLKSLRENASVLDVGCGNNSPVNFKFLRPDFRYIGIDVGDYNQVFDPKSVADEYLVVAPNEFASAVERYEGVMDGVVSAHNLEHCNEPRRVLVAMANALKIGGRMYLSFPCERSVYFPKRAGCLNFYDDNTHTVAPPVWRWRRGLCGNCLWRRLRFGEHDEVRRRDQEALRRVALRGSATRRLCAW